MSIKSEPYYWVVCDQCQVRAEYDEFSGMADEGEAVEFALEAGWTTDRQKHHCPRCPPLEVIEADE